MAELQDGSDADWTNLMALVNLGIHSESAFQRADQVDLDNLIDYMLLHAVWRRTIGFRTAIRTTGMERIAAPTHQRPAGYEMDLSPWDQEIALTGSTEDR